MSEHIRKVVFVVSPKVGQEDEDRRQVQWLIEGVRETGREPEAVWVTPENANSLIPEAAGQQYEAAVLWIPHGTQPNLAETIRVFAEAGTKHLLVTGPFKGGGSQWHQLLIKEIDATGVEVRLMPIERLQQGLTEFKEEVFRVKGHKMIRVTMGYADNYWPYFRLHDVVASLVWIFQSNKATVQAVTPGNSSLLIEKKMWVHIIFSDSCTAVIETVEGLQEDEFLVFGDRYEIMYYMGGVLPFGRLGERYRSYRRHCYAVSEWLFFAQGELMEREVHYSVPTALWPRAFMSSMVLSAIDRSADMGGRPVTVSENDTS